MPKLLLWGAGAHGRVIHDLAWACGYRDLAFVDDGTAGESVCGRRCCGPTMSALLDYTHFVVSLGDNRRGLAVLKQRSRRGLEAVVLIHPSAVISPSAGIGLGTMVLPLVVVGAGGRLGKTAS